MKFSLNKTMNFRISVPLETESLLSTLDSTD